MPSSNSLNPRSLVLGLIFTYLAVFQMRLRLLHLLLPTIICSNPQALYCGRISHINFTYSGPTTALQLWFRVHTWYPPEQAKHLGISGVSAIQPLNLCLSIKHRFKSSGLLIYYWFVCPSTNLLTAKHSSKPLSFQGMVPLLYSVHQMWPDWCLVRMHKYLWFPRRYLNRSGLNEALLFGSSLVLFGPPLVCGHNYPRFLVLRPTPM